jgi:hypothetical protein
MAHLTADPHAAAKIRGMWDRYIGQTLASRGLRHVAIRPRFPDELVDGGFDRAPYAEAAGPGVEVQESLTPEVLQKPAAQVRIPREGGVVISLDERQVELRTVFEVASDERQAEASMKRLVRVALDTLHGLAVRDVWLREVRPVAVRHGRSTHVLGWRFQGSVAWSIVALAEVGNGLETFGTAWTIALSLGDPRASLGLHSDGRAYLRFPRALAAGPVVRYRP